MNSINLVGRLTRDPELRETKGDTKVAEMRLAIPRRPKNGEQQAPVYVDVTPSASSPRTALSTWPAAGGSPSQGASSTASGATAMGASTQSTR